MVFSSFKTTVWLLATLTAVEVYLMMFMMRNVNPVVIEETMQRAQKPFVAAIEELTNTVRIQTKQLEDLSSAVHGLRQTQAEKFNTSTENIISMQGNLQDYMQQAMTSPLAEMNVFLRYAHPKVASFIHIRTSVSECKDSSDDPTRCEVPVFVSRHSVTITATCGISAKMKPTVQMDMDTAKLPKPITQGPPKHRRFSGGAFSECEQAHAQSNGYACTIHNLTEHTQYTVNFNCSWLGVVTKKTVVVKVLQQAAVALDVGTQTTKAVYYAEDKKPKVIRLSSRPDGFLPSSVWMCKDRHVFGAEDTNELLSAGCYSVDDIKVKIGYFDKLYPWDILPVAEEEKSAAKIRPKCKSTPQTPTCNLTVAQWDCAVDDGVRVLQQADTSVILASFIKYVTAKVRGILGGGPVRFVYTSPYEFPQHQSRALFDAIRIADKDDSQMLLHVPETPAAAAYCLHRRGLNLFRQKRLVILALDFGHGTSAITLLLNSESYGLQIVRGGGMPNVAGRQFDRGLAGLLNDQLQADGRPERVTPQDAEWIKREVNTRGKILFHGINVTLKTLDTVFREILELPLTRELNKMFKQKAAADDPGPTLRADATGNDNTVEAFQYSDLRHGKGVVLVFGGMSLLKSLQTFLITFFQHHSTGDEPIRVEFASRFTGTDEDSSPASFQSFVARGAAFSAAVKINHLTEEDISLSMQPLTESTFMPIRVQEMVNGRKMCKVFIQSLERVRSSGNITVEVLMNITMGDNNTNPYIDLETVLCQSSDSYNDVTFCANCQGLVEFDNEHIELNEGDHGTAKVSITATSDKNGTLMLSIGVFDLRGATLNRTSLNSYIFSFSDGHFSPKQREMHRKTAAEMVENSAYPVCSMFRKNDSSDIVLGSDYPSLKLDVRCCRQFPCSWVRSTGNNYPTLKNLIEIPHGHNVSCEWEIKAHLHDMPDPPSSIAVIFDKRDPNVTKAIRNALARFNATVSSFADTNVSLMLLALDRLIGKAGNTRHLLVDEVLRLTEMKGSDGWGQIFNMSLETVEESGEAKVDLLPALPEAVKKVCENFGTRATHNVASVVIISSGTSGSDASSWDKLLSEKAAAWTKLECLNRLDVKPTIWTLLIKGSKSDPDETELQAVQQFLGPPDNFKTAKPVQLVTNYREMETELLKVLHLCSGEVSSALSFEMNVEGTGYMACRPEIVTSRDLVAYHPPHVPHLARSKSWDRKTWLKLEQLSLFGGSLIPTRCLVGGKSEGAFRMSAGLRSTSAAGVQEHSETFVIEINSHSHFGVSQQTEDAKEKTTNIKWFSTFFNSFLCANSSSLTDELHLFSSKGFSKAEDDSWCRILGWTKPYIEDLLSSVGYFGGKVTAECKPGVNSAKSLTSITAFPNAEKANLDDNKVLAKCDRRTVMERLSKTITAELRAVCCSDGKSRHFNIKIATV